MNTLSGWKEIAAHLHQDVRTVQRWESLGFPIHRIKGPGGAQVVAFEEEIEAWEQAVPVRYSNILARLRARIECLESELAILSHEVSHKNLEHRDRLTRQRSRVHTLISQPEHCKENSPGSLIKRAA
jgi:hypothetical protein